MFAVNASADRPLEVLIEQQTTTGEDKSTQVDSFSPIYGIVGRLDTEVHLTSISHVSPHHLEHG